MITLVLLSIFGVSGWGMFGLAFRKYRQTNNVLNHTLQNYHATPLKELVSNFREFVQGVDGRVSPEIDTALKQLEAHHENKAIEVKPIDGVISLVKGINKISIPDNNIWKLMLADINLENDDEKKVEVILRWGSNYHFNANWQMSILNMFPLFNSQQAYRNKLRKYFDKNHGLV